MTKIHDFAIVGAGIAGLASAIALARAGHRATVFEQARQIDEVGAGLQIGPNAVHALQQLGVWDALQPDTFAPERIVIRVGQTARTLSQIELAGHFESRFGAPYRVAHRANLIARLLETAQLIPAIQIRTGCPVDGFESGANDVTIKLNGGEVVSADALIAADGIRSQIRSLLLNDGLPDYAGHAIFRALLPMIDVPDSTDKMSVNLWLYPGGHVVHYPVNAGRQLNIIAAADSLWVEDGWDTKAGHNEVAGLFSKAASPLKDLLAAPARWHKWAAADRLPAGRWGQGPITLIGDAAHPALPYLAQGAAMALEDAVVLGKFCQRSGPIEQAMRDYESARQSRTARLARASRRMGSIYHLPTVPAMIRNLTISSLPATVSMSQFSWIYDWKPQGVLGSATSVL